MQSPQPDPSPMVKVDRAAWERAQRTLGAAAQYLDYLEDPAQRVTEEELGACMAFVEPLTWKAVALALSRAHARASRAERCFRSMTSPVPTGDLGNAFRQLARAAGLVAEAGNPPASDRALVEQAVSQLEVAGQSIGSAVESIGLAVARAKVALAVSAGEAPLAPREGDLVLTPDPAALDANEILGNARAVQEVAAGRAAATAALRPGPAPSGEELS